MVSSPITRSYSDILVLIAGFGLAYILGMMQEELFRLLVLMVVLSMVTTALLIEVIHRLGARPRPVAAVEDYAFTHDPGARWASVIIAGFGRVGQGVARILTSSGPRSQSCNRYSCVAESYIIADSPD